MSVSPRMERRAFLAAVLASVPALGDGRSPCLLVGDSLAYMLAPPMRRVAKEAGVRLSGRGKGGTSAWQWAREPWLRDAMRAVRPSHVLISAGVNDWGVRRNREAFPDSAKRIVEKVRKAGVRSVWLLPPRIRIPTGFIREGVARSGVDGVHDASDLEIPLFNDKIHPTFKGLELWAEDVGRTLW